MSRRWVRWLARVLAAAVLAVGLVTAGFLLGELSLPRPDCPYGSHYRYRHLRCVGNLEFDRR
jgi:hypothetical protein